MLWVIAADKALTRDDKPLSAERQQQRKEDWLQLHDQATQGIPGLLPLVRGMPVRFTETTDREKAIFKNSRGVLHGWDLQDVDEERVRGTDDPEVVLSMMPKHLLVHFHNATWKVDGLPQGVYSLKPVWRVWTLDRAGNMKVRRYGFAIVPDFALSLIHI